LANARRAMDIAGHRLPAAHLRECGLQPLEISAAANQRRGPMRSRLEGDSELGLAGNASQAAEYLAARGPRFRVPPEQVDAQRGQVVGNASCKLTRGRGLELLLGHQNFDGSSTEGEVAGERLVEDRADAVPVARRRDGPAGRLFRSHVGDGAEDVWQRALV